MGIEERANHLFSPSKAAHFRRTSWRGKKSCIDARNLLEKRVTYDCNAARTRPGAPPPEARDLLRPALGKQGMAFVFSSVSQPAGEHVASGV